MFVSMPLHRQGVTLTESILVTLLAYNGKDEAGARQVRRCCRRLCALHLFYALLRPLFVNGKFKRATAAGKRKAHKRLSERQRNGTA